MNRISLDQVPPGRLRDAILAAGGDGRVERVRSSPAARPLVTTGTRDRPARIRCTGYRCSRCGLTRPAYGAVERHAAEHGAARIEAVIEATT